MSLVNQMLKDLAKKPRFPTNPEVVLSGLQAYSDPTLANHHKFYGFFAMFVVVLSAAISYSYFDIKKVKPAASFHALSYSNPAPEMIIHEAAKSTIPALTMHPAILTAITYQIKQDTTQLRFLLTQDSLYKISMDAPTNRLLITLENARLMTQTPALDYRNSGLQGMNIVNKNGDLKILLSLRQGAEINHIELHQAGKLPELQLDIIYNEPNEEPIAKINAKEMVSANNPSLSVKKLVVNSNYEERYQQALYTSSEGNSPAAIQQLTFLVNESPTFLRAREALISLLLEKDDPMQAEKILNKGLQLSPLYVPFIELKAKSLVEQGKFTEALKVLNLVTPSLKLHPDYYALLAAIYQHQGKSSQAAVLYRELLSLQSDQSKWWVGLGVALEALGKRNSALNAYAEAEKNRSNLTPALQGFIEDKMRG